MPAPKFPGLRILVTFPEVVNPPAVTSQILSVESVAYAGIGKVAGVSLAGIKSVAGVPNS